MEGHSLKHLLKLVDTAYYQQDEEKAVCEVLGHTADDYTVVTLLVNGQNVPVGKGSVEAILAEHGLSVDGWTTKPQLE